MASYARGHGPATGDNLHVARHTFASWLIANGENLRYISEQLGHSLISVTADTYGHLIPDGNKQAVGRLDGIPIREAIASATVTRTVTAAASQELTL